MLNKAPCIMYVVSGKHFLKNYKKILKKCLLVIGSRVHAYHEYMSTSCHEYMSTSCHEYMSTSYKSNVSKGLTLVHVPHPVFYDEESFLQYKIFQFALDDLYDISPGLR